MIALLLKLHSVIWRCKTNKAIERSYQGTAIQHDRGRSGAGPETGHPRAQSLSGRNEDSPPRHTLNRTSWNTELQGHRCGGNINNQNRHPGSGDSVLNDQHTRLENPSVEGPEMVTETWPNLRHPLSRPSQATLEEWKACRFVQLGWFTAEEAVTYVDLFFQNMSTLSPIMHEYYREHSNHHTLIIREPVLCCTIITLSSRYHFLSGEGAISRGFHIHDRMWRHCQSLFHQVVWGQRRALDDQTRDIGTIESFLLVTEWHPRSVHLSADLDFFESENFASRNGETVGTSQGLFVFSFSRWVYLCSC